MIISRTSRSRTIAGATVAVGVIAGLLGAAPSASAESGDTQIVTPGETAIENASDSTGIPEHELEQLVESEQVIVERDGRVSFIDRAPEHLEAPTAGTGTALAAPIPGSPAGGSRPGAPVTIYLDFDGAVVKNTSWNAGAGAQAQYDLLGASAATAAFKNEVWARIAEDYAPFNVNVTITDPGPDALFKTSAADTTYGSWLVITDSRPDFAGEAGGIASYQGAGSKYFAPAFVFTDGMGGATPADAQAKAVAEAGSHEVGHNFGLDHDGYGPEEYYSPPGGLWGPLMGAPYGSPLTQWSNGGYVNSTRAEDDLSLITDRAAAQHEFAAWERADGSYYNGSYCGEEPTDEGQTTTLPDGDVCPGTETVTARFTYTDRADYAADLVGDDNATAAALDNITGAFTSSGVIERTADVDVFKVTTIGGLFTAKVDVADIGPDLDAKLTLTDASGAVIAEDAPLTQYVDDSTASGLGAQISATVPAGIYYLTVSGVGQGDPSSAAQVALTGASAYTDYGSLGNYTLSGTAAPFVALPVDITSPADGSTVTGGAAFAVAGTAHPGAVVTLTVAGATVATVTASATGAWTANVTANATGSTVVTAAETVGGIQIAGADTVTVNAETVTPALAAPVISAPVAGSTTGTSPTFSGTGIAGAQLTLTITASDGAQTVLTIAVGANGTWSVTPGSALAAGAYTATAVQAADGQTSGASNSVSFTVQTAGNGGGSAPSSGGGSQPATGDALATTGGSDPAPLWALAIALLLAGGLVLSLRPAGRNRA